MSANDPVATVSQNGLVTEVSAGSVAAAVGGSIGNTDRSLDRFTPSWIVGAPAVGSNTRGGSMS